MADAPITDNPRADYYVYVLFDEFGRPFYVGKGSQDRIDRHMTFPKGDRSKKSAMVRHVMNAMGDVPRVKVASDLTETDAFNIERIWIAALGREPFGPLVNHTDGGEGVSNPSSDIRYRIGTGWRGKKQSPEAVAKRSAKRKGSKRSRESVERAAAKLRGRKRPPEVGQKVAAKLRGRPLSAETKAKLSAAHKGKVVDRAHMENAWAARRGGRISPETRQKMIEGYKRWAAAKKAAMIE